MHRSRTVGEMTGIFCSSLGPDAAGQRRAAILLLCAVVAGAVWRLHEQALVRAPRDQHAAVLVEPRTPDELAMILDLSVDVWTEQVFANQPVVAVLTSASMDVLTAKGIPHRIVVEDIQAVADAERFRLAQRARSATAPDWFAEYRDLQEVSDYMDMLRERHPALASLRRLGTSIEGRPIRAIEISRGGRIGIALDGGQHAREWISVMVPICIAGRLLDTHDGDPRIRKILDSVSFYVVPVINPDGYFHSWNVDRYWRKNRRDGHGVDLNRNYSVAWGQAGSSGDRSSQNYRGAHAFSEPEAQAMRTLFDSETINAHVDFHSYSQLVLYPWSHQREAPADRDKFAAIADRMGTALSAAHGEQYKIRPGSELTVGAGGTLGDWAYGEREALSFLVELRPSGRTGGGFVLPPDQIVPTCDEGLAAVLELAEWMIRHAAESPK
jgi:carboxypeptidase T